MKIKRILAIGLATVMSAAQFAGCGNTNAGGDTASKGNGTYAIIAKDVQNPNMQKVYEGFEEACEDIGGTPLY